MQQWISYSRATYLSHQNSRFGSIPCPHCITSRWYSLLSMWIRCSSDYQSLPCPMCVDRIATWSVFWMNLLAIPSWYFVGHAIMSRGEIWNIVEPWSNNSVQPLTKVYSVDSCAADEAEGKFDRHWISFSFIFPYLWTLFSTDSHRQLLWNSPCSNTATQIFAVQVKQTPDVTHVFTNKKSHAVSPAAT